MERSGLASPSDSCMLNASSQISTARFGSLDSRPFAFSLSCSSFDMGALRYSGREGRTSRTCCPDGAYEIRAHPICDLAPVIYRSDNEVGDEARRDLTPLAGESKRRGSVDRYGRHSFRVTKAELRHPKRHDERQTQRRRCPGIEIRGERDRRTGLDETPGGRLMALAEEHQRRWEQHRDGLTAGEGTHPCVRHTRQVIR